MDVDMHENEEELSFVPSVRLAILLNGTNTKFLCDRQCKFYEIAAILVEDDGKPHTRNLCILVTP